MELPIPEFVNLPERTLVALSDTFTLDTRNKIPGLWNEFWERQWKLPGEQEPACYGVSYLMQPDGQFSYAVGIYVEPTPEVLPEDACLVKLLSGRYAVFKRQGPVTEIPEMFDTIFGSWLPASEETPRDAPVFERYPFQGDSSPENMAYEIWVPVS